MDKKLATTVLLCWLWISAALRLIGIGYWFVPIAILMIFAAACVYRIIKRTI